MSRPDVTVEIAFDSGYTTPAVSRTWTDVTEYVESTVSIERGRADNIAAVQPSSLSVTFDNTDGRFTPENAAGAYYPNVKKGRPIRVSATTPGNLLSAANASFESGVGSWVAAGAAPPSVTASNVRATDGTDSLRLGWPASAGDSRTNLTVTGTFTIGETYTIAADLYVPSGQPDVFLSVATIGDSALMTTKDAWVRWSYTFVATGTGHIFRVNRVTGSSSSGNCWVDSVMVQPGSVATDFTTSGPTTRVLFTGYVDEWPVVWPDGTDAMSTVSVTAMSRMARLGRSAEFRSIVEEEILPDGPVLYFPLGEPDGSTTAGNIAPDRSETLVVTQGGTGGAITFGSGVAASTDGLSAPVFAPVNALNGKMLRADLNGSITASGDHSLEIEMLFVASGTPGYVQVLNTLSNGQDSQTFLLVTLETSGQVKAEWTSVGNLVTVSATSTGATKLDGLLHHIKAAVLIDDAGTATVSITTDGTTVTSAPGAYPYRNGGVAFFPSMPILTIGGPVTPTVVGYFVGTIGHVAIYAGAAATSSTVFDRHRLAATTGFAGESSGDRIERYARLAGIPDVEVSAEPGLTTSMAHLEITGASPLSAMEEVAQTEDGVLFDAGDGTLTFHGRDHRFGATSTFTLDCEAGDVGEGLTPTLDDQGVTNDMTASRPSGVTVRSINQPSIDEIGYYRDSIEVLTTSDAEVQDRADWQVNRFGFPRVSIPDVQVDLLSSGAALQADLLDAEIGTRFTIDNLPSQAPATTQDFFIEGITHTIGAEVFTISFNTSAADSANVWTLDSATLSQLDESTILAY
jgi:hypothetical protein